MQLYKNWQKGPSDSLQKLAQPWLGWAAWRTRAGHSHHSYTDVTEALPVLLRP